jgi:hypothetical protein
MTNDEARMPNETAMTNDELLLRHRCVIAVSSFMRHSDFGIRHFSGVMAPATNSL